MDKYSLIGKHNKRVDARQKVMGQAKYAADIVLPRMLYGKILRSSYAHARIASIDTSKAEKVSGVKGIITAKDVPHNNWGHSGRNDEQVLAFDKVRYIGDEVAAVAAIDEDTAEEALDLISVEYQELPAVFDIEEAMKPDAPRIHEDLVSNIGCEQVLERGDIEKGFQEADVIVEDTFTTQGVVHSHIEPVACVASWDADGKLTLWQGGMWPSGIRLDLATVLNLPLSMIRVINCHVGGAHGNRIRIIWGYPIAAILSKKTGRPVKIIQTREEEFITTRYRPVCKLWMKLGAKKDGTLTAEHVKWLRDNGAYAYHGRNVQLHGARKSDSTYHFQNVKWELQVVHTNNATTGNFRSHGFLQPTFVRETMMDELAEKLGIDLGELKLKNAVKTGDITMHGARANSCGFSECIQKTVKMTGWKEKSERKQFGRGIGMASMAAMSDGRVFPGITGATVFVKILEDGKIVVTGSEAEYGQGGDTACAIVAATELGVPIDRVEVIPLDTDISPFGLGPFGDGRLCITETSATYLACQDAKKQLFEKASPMLGAKIEQLEIGGGRISVAGSPEKYVSVADVARAYIFGSGTSAIIGKGTDVRPTDLSNFMDHQTHYGQNTSAFYFDNIIAEVEVDTATGEVTVLKLTLAVDCGRVVNLAALAGQIQGGRAFGFGQAFLEERVTDRGRVVNTSFADYKIPSALDMPPLEIVYVESMEPSNPYGAKGGSFAGMHTIVPAITNAIYNAVGVRIKDLPITPEKLLRALEIKDKGMRA